MNKTLTRSRDVVLLEDQTLQDPKLGEIPDFKIPLNPQIENDKPAICN